MVLKIVVLSDSHRAFGALLKVVKLHEDADLFIFLGDGEEDIRQLFLIRSDLEEKFLLLQGNCDTGRLNPQTRLELDYTLPYGHKIFAAHGHCHQAEWGPSLMIPVAKNHHADILLYGHLHCRDNRYEEGLYIMNPGSLSRPRDGKPASYGVISISEKGVLISIADVPMGL